MNWCVILNKNSKTHFITLSTWRICNLLFIPGIADKYGKDVSAKRRLKFPVGYGNGSYRDQSENYTWTRKRRFRRLRTGSVIYISAIARTLDETLSLSAGARHLSPKSRRRCSWAKTSLHIGCGRRGDDRMVYNVTFPMASGKGLWKRFAMPVSSAIRNTISQGHPNSNDSLRIR